MGLKCPFLSAPVANVSGSGTGGDMIISSTIVMHYYDCLEIDCKIWDHINSRCGAMTSDIHVHVHNEHHHVKTHRGSESTVVITDAPNHFVNTLPTINPDMYEDAPDPESAQGAPNAATLIDEYLNKKDTVVVIEWAERIKSYLKKFKKIIWIKITDKNNQREFNFLK